MPAAAALEEAPFPPSSGAEPGVPAAAAATAGTFTMAQYGLATMIQETANNWVLSGVGLTAP